MAYTTIDKPTDYFNTKLYTGTGSSLANTGVGFQPDLTWIKGRSGATEHVLTDSVRGVTKELSSNDTGAEETVAQGLTAFGSDGFTVGTDGSYNTSSATYASWNWLASNSTASNTDGSITSTVSANTTSGFSIVSYTGNGSTATVGHGLGATVDMVIVKDRSRGTEHWVVYHKDLGKDKLLLLSGTDASATSSNYWGTSTPDSSVFGVQSGSTSNNWSGDNFIAYCFAEKKGYSKFGSYTGNGNADGTFVYTGFKPAFVLLKNSTGANGWEMRDNKRPGYNLSSGTLAPNSSDAETTGEGIDILSNGFKLRASGNGQNGANTYIYMAFAEAPFVNSNGVPCNAR